MKIDMHCHVKEGSIDSKVSVEEYITILKSHGFDGMLITDHDTYKGYRYWKKEVQGKVHKDFIVLKGIEYDTLDAGHILVIMPEGVKMRLLELRGLPVSILIDFVHHHGGILGPAHPCGEKYLSFTKTKRFRKSPEIVKRFDFIEGFNACEDEESNIKAVELAEQYHLPILGGSDSHKADCVGLGYTIFPRLAKTEMELISMIRSRESIEIGGSHYTGTTKDKIGKINKILVYSFWFYNKGGEMIKRRKRKEKIQTERPIEAIDPIEIPYLEHFNRFNRKQRRS